MLHINPPSFTKTGSNRNTNPSCSYCINNNINSRHDSNQRHTSTNNNSLHSNSNNSNNNNNLPFNISKRTQQQVQ